VVGAEEAEVDPNVLPEDDGVVAAEEEEDGEDLFNDNYLE
jgi:DNA replication licensing factor MCM2